MKPRCIEVLASPSWSFTADSTAYWTRSVHGESDSEIYITHRPPGSSYTSIHRAALGGETLQVKHSECVKLLTIPRHCVILGNFSSQCLLCILASPPQPFLYLAKIKYRWFHQPSPVVVQKWNTVKCGKQGPVACATFDERFTFILSSNSLMVYDWTNQSMTEIQAAIFSQASTRSLGPLLVHRESHGKLKLCWMVSVNAERRWIVSYLSVISCSGEWMCVNEVPPPVVPPAMLLLQKIANELSDKEAWSPRCQRVMRHRYAPQIAVWPHHGRQAIPGGLIICGVTDLQAAKAGLPVPADLDIGLLFRLSDLYLTQRSLYVSTATTVKILEYLG